MPYTGLHRFMCISLFAQSYSSIIQYNQLVIEDESKSERHRKKIETLFFLLGRRFSNNVMLCIWYRSMYVLCFSLLFLLSISPFAISFEFCCVVCFFSLAIFIFACRRTIFVYSLPITLYTLFCALFLSFG